MDLPIFDINRELSTPASKFNTAFAKNPMELFDRIRETTNDQWHIEHSSDTKTDYRIAFDKVQWKQGIGEDAIIAVSELSSEQRKMINLRQRDKLCIQTLQVPKLPSTTEMIVVVVSAGQTITAFPGRWLPPLNEELSKKWIFLVT